MLKMFKTALDVEMQGDDELILPGKNVVKRHRRYSPLYRKPVMIVRDPRDVFVSYFFHQTKHRPDSQVLEAIGFDPDNALEDSLFKFIKLKNEGSEKTYPFFSYLDFVSSWLSQNGLQWTRYEDLHSQPEVELSRLFNSLGYAVNSEQIQHAIEANTFKKMSGGRLPGEEDPTSHRRKGVVGDWKNYFSEEMSEYVRTRYQDVFSVFGYFSED